MKKILVFLVAALVLAAPSAHADSDFPMTLAGFTLGQSVDQYSSRCRLDERIPLSDAPFLSESRLKDEVMDGIRGGSLAYGNCLNKGKLVRIKLKFEDRSKDLFEQLLKRYKAQFGAPDRYIGDAFKNVIAWEWVFRNGNNEEISLVLMWSRDKEIRPGVSIKMTHNTLMEKEYHCYSEQYMGRKGKNKGRSKVHDLDEYIPR